MRVPFRGTLMRIPPRRNTKPVQQDDNIDHFAALHTAQSRKIHLSGVIEQVRAMLVDQQSSASIALIVVEYDIELFADCRLNLLHQDV